MNHKPILFLFSILIIVSCTQTGKRSIADSADPTDTICKLDLDQAKADIDNGKLVYCHLAGEVASARAGKEMDSLLRKYDIQYKEQSSPGVMLGNWNYHCYCDLMQEEIREKFGIKFTDSLLYHADSLWALRNQDKIFDNSDSVYTWDNAPLYPGDKTNDQANHPVLQAAYDKLVKYPANYRYKQGENSTAMVRVYVDVDQLGKATVTDSHVIFGDSKTDEVNYNKEHRDYFVDIAKKLIEEATWTPATIKNVKVKSKSDFYIYLK